ncbi:MAG TPA: serine protease [Candidatus Acidoferrales bacterium]|nr:serine protease [Candidatus Acidoferrales bacterium]
MKFFFHATLLALLSPLTAAAAFLSGPDQLRAEGASFNWEQAKARSLKILVEYRDGQMRWKRANLGSGFLISPDGLFVTAYHVVKYCLEKQKEISGFASPVDCSAAHPIFRYKAVSGNIESGFEVLSYLRERDSLSGKGAQTPDDTIKHRDFVVGRLKAGPHARFEWWPVKDFDPAAIDLSDPQADFELKPLLPPRKVFIAGYPLDEGFAIAHGFLNVTEKNRRGYFAADLKIYDPAYLETQGIAPDTRWGIRVENHMSGGAVVDAEGYVVGVLVSGDGRSAGVLSIENVLGTFFARAHDAAAPGAVFLSPTNAPLHLRRSQD